MIKKLFSILIIIATPFYQVAAQKSNADTTKLVIGIKEEPPFVIKDVDGSIYGLSIDLWYYLADDLDLRYEFKEYHDQLSLLRALNFQEIDISINPFLVNGVRLKLFDAAQPFYISSIGIAVSGSQTTQFQVFLSNMFSVNFLRLIGLLLAMILVFGVVMYLIERRKNPQQFSGLLDGFWWSVVTMTTVGYGDKAPKTIIGRTISVGWMFIAIVLISAFTATIASTMTINSLEGRINRFEDIVNLGTIGSVDYSASIDYLKRHNIPPQVTYPTPLEGLADLADGKIDVFVYDRSVILYLIKEYDLESIKIIPLDAHRQYKSFLLPKNSQLLSKINPPLVDQINVSSWKKNLQKYHLESDD